MINYLRKFADNNHDLLMSTVPADGLAPLGPL